MRTMRFSYPEPKNEPVLEYRPGSGERRLLKVALDEVSSRCPDIPLIIGGREIRTGDRGDVVMPHDHGHVLATYHKAGPAEVELAIEAALAAKERWAALPWEHRAAVMLRVAELVSTKYRFALSAATMMGQSKNVHQSEIDAVAETADFLRFNVWYASRLYGEQPGSETCCLNSMDYRPLEGFVYAVTPFNFTAIASNLVLAPLLMGNVVLWKPSTAALLSNYLLMTIYEEAGVPAGVVNFLPGPGRVSSAVALRHRDFAGLHFTGSTEVFRAMWRTVGESMDRHRSFPRIVGETGGKDFAVVHPSADVLAVASAIVRGAFEYQGQKCSALSRCYIPASLRDEIVGQVGDMLGAVRTGDPRDFRNFVNAVIDEESYDRCMKAIAEAKASAEARVLFGGEGDKSRGYFVEPTVIETTNPRAPTMEEELFGPVLTLYVYDDEDFDGVLRLCDATSPYALTGAVFARDRQAIVHASDVLRNAAGNFYINDKPTGAVVGRQPFGGSRASGTNDKAGSILNLVRWTSPRAIKENLLPPEEVGYPFMAEE
ncbi:MAG TPA: 1-pyrroline-5-carboxylate dehydrogenase [Synergistaceae bacterium]|nr:1-pyrroline-5-carboxylate dehydrogenase [Synergistaceae bacterium]